MKHATRTRLPCSVRLGQGRVNGFHNLLSHAPYQHLIRSPRRQSVKVEFRTLRVEETAEPTVRDIPTNSVLAIVLGGGAGAQLFPLTYRRSEPAITFAGSYRLIDIPLSNSLNSGIKKVYVLTQYNSQSLNRHVTLAYNTGPFKPNSFIEILAAQQTPKDSNWFQGTADAIRQFVWLLEDTQNRAVEHVVILAADQVYRMDYMAMVEAHVQSGADVTIACTRVAAARAGQLGLLKVNADGRVIKFAEKPRGQALQEMAIEPYHADGVSSSNGGHGVLEYHEGSSDGQNRGQNGATLLMDTSEQPRPFLGSMGIYVFSKRTLVQLLKKDFAQAADFARDILPALLARGSNVQAFVHNGYWEDLGNNIKDYFEANLAIAADEQNFNLFDPSFPVFTSQRFLPPAKLLGARLTDAMVGNGSVLQRCTIDHAVIGHRVRIGEGCVIKDAVVCGADYYESDATRERILAMQRVPVGIGPRCTISNTIVDKNCRIGADCQLVNKDGVTEGDRADEGIYIRDGIVVVVKGSELPNGTVV